MNDTASSRRKVIALIDRRASRRSGAAARRPGPASSRPPAATSQSRRARRRGPPGAGGQPRLADEQHGFAGQLHQRFDTHMLLGDRPLLLELALMRARPGSPRPRQHRPPRAPSAPPMRPATGRGARPASRPRPSARCTGSRGSAAPSAIRRRAHRAGCSSRRRPSGWVSKPASRAAKPSWLGDPRSRSSPRATSAASIWTASGLERLLDPDDLHLPCSHGPRARMLEEPLNPPAAARRPASA